MISLTKNAGGMKGALSAFPEIKLQLADGTIYNHPGKVVKASGVIDAATGSVSLIAHFANPEHTLRSGGSGQIVIPTLASNSIIIPQEATSEVQNKKFVYVVGKDNKVKYTEIQVNPQDDGKTYIVTAGLKVSFLLSSGSLFFKLLITPSSIRSFPSVFIASTTSVVDSDINEI